MEIKGGFFMSSTHRKIHMTNRDDILYYFSEHELENIRLLKRDIC